MESVYTYIYVSVKIQLDIDTLKTYDSINLTQISKTQVKDISKLNFFDYSNLTVICILIGRPSSVKVTTSPFITKSPIITFKFILVASSSTLGARMYKLLSILLRLGAFNCKSFLSINNWMKSSSVVSFEVGIVRLPLPQTPQSRIRQ